MRVAVATFVFAQQIRRQVDLSLCGLRATPVETLIDDLPLFARLAETSAPKDSLRDAVQEIDPDQMTPREALAALYELKKKL
ncbi:hypothetical protein F7D13_09670 [Methylocystis rosea]|uniref:DNA mismatch repair protein MutS n=1 Tax=Methylocystis rosea TaxID=173366 RepID=A0ABX6EJH0_9HYPH|nr:hypothetical protein [Methylocystis rosea]QGM94275.1 hypothetical protein F7D13_09670 [Methylocystis rosea]